MNKAIGIILVTIVTLALSSCYKNYYDISSSALSTINAVSFRSDVVPIVVGGGCGCHNNGSSSQVAFSHKDTVFYGAILARSGKLLAMANGGLHPGEGGVSLTPSQSNIIKEWCAQGAKDDYSDTAAITGTIAYTANILPIYLADCKGSTCHGGVGPTLDYALLKSVGSSILTPMMQSQGASSHPGGVISVESSVAKTFLTWIAQGYQP